MSNAFKNGHLVTAITNFMKGEKKEFREEYGLIPAHAYTLLDVVRVCSLDIKLVKLRNPTTVSEWKGPWSRQALEWTPALRSEINFEEEKGVLYMSETDFLSKFRKTIIC